MCVYFVALGLIVFDIASGLLKAWHNGNFDSSIMRNGGCHKLAEILILALSAYVSYALPFVESDMGLGFMCVIPVYMCTMEIISILENVSAVSPEMEKMMKPFLGKLKDKGE